MSGKDPELSRLGEALSSARSAYAAAKKITDETKARLNETGSRIQTFNAKISELKKGIDAEYSAMRAERANGDRDAADGHRSLAQQMQEKLTEIYESKKACFGELDEARAAFNKALDTQKILRDKVQEAWDGFNARLEYLKSENAKEQAKWKEKPCKICGSTSLISARNVLTKIKRTGKIGHALNAARLSGSTRAGSIFRRSAVSAARS